MRVLFWARLALAKREVKEALERVEGADVVVVETLPALLQALPGCRGLVLADAPVTEAREVVQALSRPDCTVEWMHFISAGREGFEEAGLPSGLTITYAEGAVAPTVAEHAMALLLALVRCVPDILAQAQKFEWSRAPSAHTRTLEGGLMAIVGYGQIGRHLARRARGFGMRVAAVSRSGREDDYVDEAHRLPDLPGVLARADVIVSTIALTAETRLLFDMHMFAACKPGALFINVARGGLVDQPALIDALGKGQLGGAAVDVTEPEPLPSNDPLWQAPNMIISPHIASSGSGVSMQRLAGSAADNLRRFIDGQPLLGVISA